MRLTKAQATLALAVAAAVAIGNAWTLANAISDQRGFTTILVFAVSTIATMIAVGVAFYLLWPRPRHRARARAMPTREGFVTVSAYRDEPTDKTVAEFMEDVIERDRARVRKWAANL